MQAHKNSVLDPSGNIIEGATVSIYDAGTSNLSTIYSDNGITSKTNPILTDTDGEFQFWAADGVYDVTTTYSGLTDTYEIILYDPIRDGTLLIQAVEATPYTTYSSHATVIPLDNTIPQNTEGDEIITVSITPKNTGNRLRVTCSIPNIHFVTSGGADAITMALFQDSVSDALSISTVNFSISAGNVNGVLPQLVYEMAAGTVVSTIFKIRVGPSNGTLYINGNAANRLFGGISAVRLRVEEISVP